VVVITRVRAGASYDALEPIELHLLSGAPIRRRGREAAAGGLAAAEAERRRALTTLGTRGLVVASC